MHECPDCGKMTLRVWQERHEFHGSPCYEQMDECINEHCGEPDCEDCGGYDDVVDNKCRECREDEN